MSTGTMSFALPPDMREYVDERVSGGMYGNTSEYIRELIRKDQDEQARKRLRELIQQGLASGEPVELTAAVRKRLRARALGQA
jgi:antitoxin ParD1/3/4